MRNRFPRQDRLRKRADFLLVQGTGAKVHARHFMIIVRRRGDGDGDGRVGITVSKKIGNAVTRNRLKRRLREFVRRARTEQGSWVPAGRDVVIIAKRSAAEIDFAELTRDLARQRDRVAAC